MKRIREQAEVIIRLDYLEGKAHICVSSWPSMASKMQRKYGEGLDGPSEDSARRWIVPLKTISFRGLKAKSNGNQMGNPKLSKKKTDAVIPPSTALMRETLF